MFKTTLVAVATLFCAQTHAETLVPFKVDVPAVCGFPSIQLPEGTVVLAAGALGGKRVNFQIDQSGNTATQIDVAVNYPDKPVALMLGASEPTIWNIGWTEGTNIVAVFASGYNRQRVAGIKKDTPLLISSHADNGPCNISGFLYSKLNLHDGFVASFGYGQITDINQAGTEQKLSQILFSRPISKIFSVPDDAGKVVIGAPLGANQTVVTSDATPPLSYYDKNAPLAGQAGLDLAMKKGILRRATLKDAKKWINALKKKYTLQNRQPPDIPPDLNNAYVVLKKFTYPAGLYGGQSATFYIPEGAPLPTGDYGHSKIYDLNSISMECSGGSACGQAIMSGSIGRGATQQVTTINSSGSTITYKQSLAEENKTKPEGRGSTKHSVAQIHGSRSVTVKKYEAPTPVNIPPVKTTSTQSQDTELHAIGVYEGPRHFGGPVDDPSSSTINVRIHTTPKPLILAFYNYESVLWKLSLDDGVVIKEIILSSYNNSKVSGIDEKAVKITRRNMGIVYNDETAENTAPTLTEYTGLSIGSFQTSYKGAEFSVGP